MKKNTALNTLLMITAFGTVTAHAGLIGNEGPGCAAAGSPCNLYQWAHSGPVVTTVQSMSNAFGGGFSAPMWGYAGQGPGQSGSGSGFFHGGNPGNHGPSTPSPFDPPAGHKPTPAPQAVPEPGTFALMGLGLLGMAYAKRRKAQGKAQA